MKKVTNKVLLAIAALFITGAISIVSVFTCRFNNGTLFPENEQIMPIQSLENANIFLDDASSVCTNPDTVTVQP
jgi:hypothetical protein